MMSNLYMNQHLDLDALQAAAELLCGEEWKFVSCKTPGASCNSVVNLADAVICDDEHYYPHAVELDHMQFIAAANPAVVLALIDRLRRAEAASKWQPIETAPKDGTDIILARGERVTVGHWTTEEECRYVISNGTPGGDPTEYEYSEPSWISWDGGFTTEHPPVLWQPLPAAPDSTPTDSAEKPGEK